MRKRAHESRPHGLRRRERPLLPQRQRGVALLIAILLVALGTMVAAAMAYNNAMTARRTLSDFSYDQALMITQGAEAYAAYGLWRIHKSDPNSTYPAQGWDKPLNDSPSPGVAVQASLEDLQGRFNLNDLVEDNGITPNRVAIGVFRRLLRLVGLQPHWAEDVVNWIDASPTPFFPEAPSNSAYLEMDPPYYTPNLPITSTSELLALPGFGRKRFDKIAPYITALPVGTGVNVCSASAVVLDAFLGARQFSVNPKQFAKDREASGQCFPKLQQFDKDIQNTPGTFIQSVPNGPALLSAMIGKQSSYFRLSTYVSAGPAEFAFYSLLYRDDSGKVRPLLLSDTPN